MSSDVVIRATDLGKCYQIYNTPRDRLLQMLMRGRKQFYREFWAVSEMSLEARQGEAIGIIGSNGAGKSTLLQMICGTLNPTCGTVRVNGRIAALLELGAGFNPEFTGRENVFLSAAIIGVPEDEIAEKYDEIVQFSGVGDFIDQPVKTYSSGMYVRLAFSVATTVNPDILVVDEALSVGDGEFSRKSFDRIVALKKRGTTVLFCSHALYQVEAFCDRVLWLDRGKCVMSGDPKEIVSKYNSFLLGNMLVDQQQEDAELSSENRSGQGRITYVTVSMDGVEGRQLRGTSGESTLNVKFEFYVDPSLPLPVLGVNIEFANQFAISTAVSQTDRVEIKRNAQGYGSAELIYPELALRKGEYQVSVYLACENAVHFYDHACRVSTFEMTDAYPEPGLVPLLHDWRLEMPDNGTSDLHQEDPEKSL